MKKMLRKVMSLVMVFLFMGSISVSAFADTYDIAGGSITVNATESGQTVTQGSTTKDDAAPVITGTSSSNTVTIDVAAGSTANVMLQDVNISSSTSAPVKVAGGGDVTIELNGDNILSSSNVDYGSSGLELNDSSNIAIQDGSGEGTGTLTAIGAGGGAGIGSAPYGMAGGDITINSGVINAQGGSIEFSGGGAGIGSGAYGTIGDITINGGTVIANGAVDGAGIGSGTQGYVSDITISSGDISANGGDGDGIFNPGADIGNGGLSDNLVEIVISGDAKVSAEDGTLDFGDITVDTSKLTAEGSINGVAGTYVPPTPEAETPAAPAVSSDYYYVQVSEEPFTVSGDYTMTEKDEMLILTVNGEAVELEITVSGIRELIDKGLLTLVFVTDKGEIELDLSELLKDCTDTDVLVIRCEGDEIVITLNGKKIEVK